MSEKKNRYFKILIGNDKPHGRYTGDSPYQAANKAFSEYSKKNKLNNKDVKFSLIESTKGSNGKEHQYIGNRQLLDEPIKYKINDGKEIVKFYKNSIKKIKKNEN